jgi:DNA-binding transcriptional LysR family regulator
MYSHQLDTFLRVAELGSFSKAAEALYISVPSVIQQINLLESRYGFSLFFRTNRGVTLTEAGKSLYKDGKFITQFSLDALARAQLLATASAGVVRVGISLLYRCKMITEIWLRIKSSCPDLKIEILPMPERQTPAMLAASVGIKYDIREGIFSSIAQQDVNQFFELLRVPISCAVSKRHRFVGRSKLKLEELDGECLVMPQPNRSAEMDAFQEKLRAACPHSTFEFVDYYGVDLFTYLAMRDDFVLISHPIYAPLHAILFPIALDVEDTMPYGLTYAKQPSAATQKFIAEAKKIWTPDLAW